MADSLIIKYFYWQYKLSVEQRTEFHQICQERYQGQTKKNPHVGTLHQSVDWILKADLDKKYSFPLHIAYTELQPGITIYSNLTKKVILIELTCPCQENEP